MKKLAAIATCLAALNCLRATEISALNLITDFKFSSEQSTRGRKKGDKVITSKAELWTPVFEKGKFYYGVIAVLGLDSEKASNEISPYIGMLYLATDKFTLDAGCSHTFNTNFQEECKRDHIKRDTTEIYCGISANVLLSPSLYVFYDLDAEDLDFESFISHTIDLANNFALELGAKLGYRRANKPGACEKYDEAMGSKDYFYGGTTADLVYGLNEYSKLRVGAEFACNSAKRDAWANANGGHKSLLWFNASANFSF
ncbi:MAG: hypothetical protein LBS87_02140 [Puniceicoccales bacterium]|jgi:hypothetical protein|nr:hypothetical protein [Puniceicoccales bacterium]